MASIGNSKSGMRNQGSIADLIVKGAIALVTAAFFIGAYLQFQVTFWLALIAALSVYITLLMLHTLMRRSERVDALVSEVTRLESELAQVKGGRPQGEYAPPARGALRRGTPASPPPPPRLDTKAPPARSDARVAPSAATGPSLQEPVLPSPPSQSMPKSKLAAMPAPELSVPQADLSPNLPPWPSPSGAAEPMQDYWSFRPERPQLPEAGRRKKDAALPEGEREADLEAVQGMIKRLASEVSLSTPAPAGERASPESAVRASVDALYSTADTMRAATKKVMPGAPRQDRDAPAAMPPPIAPGHARLSSVAEAMAARRMDVCLEPIVGLADHQLHHYEVIVRPRDEKGGLLPLPGQDRQLARTGLLPLIDAARLKWAARMAASFVDRGQKHRVFSATSAESLTADRFLDELANAYRQRNALADELVLMFSQADVKMFGGNEWNGLAEMRDLGFRFGLTDVTDLDYEFTALTAAGFAFVKLDAADLLKGISGPGGLPMSAVDVCRYLGELSLTPIVDGIADEVERAAALESGVPLGEGPLFGPPVAVEQSAVGAPGNAAA